LGRQPVETKAGIFGEGYGDAKGGGGGGGVRRGGGRNPVADYHLRARLNDKGVSGFLSSSGSGNRCLQCSVKSRKAIALSVAGCSAHALSTPAQAEPAGLHREAGEPAGGQAAGWGQVRTHWSDCNNPSHTLDSYTP
jgi:hypothetical protein